MQLHDVDFLVDPDDIPSLTVAASADRDPPGLRAKVARPRLPCDHVVRPRLIRLLNRGLARRLTVVVAPAGYGKTTLLSAWNPDGYTVAWVSLDEGDGDRRVFARTLVGAVKSVAPGVGTSVLNVLSLAELPPNQTLAAFIAEDLAEIPDGIAIVLDDFHAVRAGEIDDLLGRLVLRLGENVHVVLASRDNPVLPLSMLRSRGELNEIHLEELAFRDDEARAFLDNALPAPLPATDVPQLVEGIEGWPAGLRLAALAIADASDETQVSVEYAARGKQHAREFIVDEAGRLLRLAGADEARTFPSFVEIPDITLARWLLLQGTQRSLQEAESTVSRLHHQALSRRSPLWLVRAQAVEALMLQARGDTEGAMAVLRSVIAVTMPGDVLRFFVDFGSPMRRLLVELERKTLPTNPYLTRILAAFPPLTGPIDMPAPSRHQSQSTPLDSLTSRELDVLQLLSSKLSNKEIGRALQIAPETVKKHTGSIYQKLQVGSRRQAVTRVHGLGLLHLVPPSGS